MAVGIRVFAAVAFVGVITTGVQHVNVPDVNAMSKTHMSCEKVNEFGDCEQDPPQQQNGGSNCVLVNELGACEDQQEVDNPPHTMDR
ncbi:hypothetical protein [Mycobacteroides saopaulense]|uniref:hypothetical protein n=1 Tax=Mycobacteroides saopaulense TaxID=1578165 RepID=UPI001041E7D6|nr:hypothetical protein [Mycobacteroides saopaulense]